MLPHQCTPIQVLQQLLLAHVWLQQTKGPPTKTLKCLGASKPDKSAVPGSTQKCLATEVCMATTQDTSSLAKAFEV